MGSATDGQILLHAGKSEGRKRLPICHFPHNRPARKELLSQAVLQSSVTLHLLYRWPSGSQSPPVGPPGLPSKPRAERSVLVCRGCDVLWL